MENGVFQNNKTIWIHYIPCCNDGPATRKQHKASSSGTIIKEMFVLEILVLTWKNSVKRGEASARLPTGEKTPNFQNE